MKRTRFRRGGGGVTRRIHGTMESASRETGTRLGGCCLLGGDMKLMSETVNVYNRDGEARLLTCQLIPCSQQGGEGGGWTG